MACDGLHPCSDELTGNSVDGRIWKAFLQTPGSSISAAPDNAIANPPQDDPYVTAYVIVKPSHQFFWMGLPFLNNFKVYPGCLVSFSHAKRRKGEHMVLEVLSTHQS